MPCELSSFPLLLSPLLLSPSSSFFQLQTITILKLSSSPSSPLPFHTQARVSRRIIVLRKERCEMPPLPPPPPLDSSFASSSSSSLSPSLQPSTSPTVGPSSMPPISQPGLRARAAYRAYLPPRPNLNWRRSFRTTATNKDQTTEGGEGQKKKRRGMGCE